jgi:cysteinyl-tRNA synthetase
MLKLYNTLKRKKEEFKPIDPKEVGLYGCGPTVYWFQHIGNMRRYIFEDTLKRVLFYNDYKVKHVINLTDVGHLSSDADEGEDRMMKAIKRENLPLVPESMLKITEKYSSAFFVDLKKLNIIFPDVWSKATEHIKEMIELIKRMEKKGYTYKTSVGLIFDTSKYKNYAKLGKLTPEQLKAGARVEIDPERKNPSDFALWITNQPNHVMQWDSPWGKGFPGWHIECSAMSMKYLGEQFDIHTGGEEHIPVHHTNEIAQSEAATGKKWVNYWLHMRWLTLRGAKMSKSKGEIATLSQLEGLGYKPMHFRYLCLLTTYRKNLDFTYEALDAAKTTFDRITKKVVELKKEHHKGEDFTEKYEKDFLSAVNDDLNTPKAVQVFIKALEDFDFDTKRKLALLEKMDEVLGLGVKEMKEEIVKVPSDVQKLIDAREKLRKEKKWAEADIFRERIKEKGYLLKDTSSGVVVEKA